MTFGLCAVAIIAYALIPKLIIRILYGSAYLEIFPLLIYSGIAFSFLALSNLILVYALSTRRLRNPAYLFVFLILEILLLFFFSETMREYVLAFMVSNIVMFIGSIFFLRKQ